MEKIVFLIPPFFRLLGSQNRRMLPAIHQLAEVAAKEGYETVVFNGDHDPDAGDTYGDWYSIANNWRSYQRSVKDGDPIFDAVAEKVLAMNPTAVVVGIGDVLIPTVDLGSIDTGRCMIEALKARQPDLYTVAYGPQVTFNTEETLKWSDAAIQYEGERVIGMILKDRPKGAVNGGQLLDAEMKDLPFLDPERLVIPVGAHDLDYIMAGRGCPYTCNFCLAPMLSRKVRRYPIGRFIDEVDHRYSKFGVKWFYIADMIFELQKKRALELCDAMVRREFPQKGIRWTCESRVDTIDREKAVAMKKAGCVQVKLGVEAGTDEQLAAMDKGITTQKAKECFDMLRDVGLKITAYVLLGQIGATKDTYERDYDFLKSLNADYYVVNVSVPYKGTPLYDQVSAELHRRGFLRADAVEKYFTHLSGSLIDFWNLDSGIIEKFMQLSGTTVKGKEDSDLRKFERRLLP